MAFLQGIIKCQNKLDHTDWQIVMEGCKFNNEKTIRTSCRMASPFTQIIYHGNMKSLIHSCALLDLQGSGEQASFFTLAA
jgi:hypothetical protein